MKNNSGYKISPHQFQTQGGKGFGIGHKRKITIHSLAEIDITTPRCLLREHFERKGKNYPSPRNRFVPGASH